MAIAEVNSDFKALLEWDDRGWGVLFADPIDYGKPYFENYVALGKTEMGKRIAKFRSLLVSKFTHGRVLDFGSGAGTFIDEHGYAVGYDICPDAMRWLLERGLYVNPFKGDVEVDGVCFWDSLEHLADPDVVIKNLHVEYLFISMPIFKDRAHAVASKHFKPGEHLWYWTKTGLAEYLRRVGYTCLDVFYDETELGREDVTTFVFRRKQK